MRRVLFAIALPMLLSACGASREELSFQACAESAREATERSRTYSDVQKASFAIDDAESRASVRLVESDVFELRIIASINSEQGTATRQDFLCRARFSEDSDQPDVIAFNFLLEGQ